MKTLRFSFFALLALVSAACESPADRDDEANPYQSPRFLNLVDMHCRAVDYKNRRLELADSIQALQGPMTGRKKELIDRGDAARHDSLKTILATDIRILSDSIRIALRELTGDMGPDQKRLFNDSLDAYVARAGCRERVE